MKPLLKSFALDRCIALAIATSATLPATALARVDGGGNGSGAGGGGDIVICQDAAITHRLLDVVEAEGAPNYFKLDLGGAELTLDQKLELMAARLATIDPDRAAAYLIEARKVAEDLEAQNAGKPGPHKLALLADQRIEDIDDEDLLFKVPEGCTKEQLVVQRHPKNENDRFYNFDSKLWNLMNADQKTATLYHEVIYREFRAKKHKTSLSARYFNSLLFSGKITALPGCKYMEKLVQWGFSSFRYQGEVLVEEGKGYTCHENSQFKAIPNRLHRTLSDRLWLDIDYPTFDDSGEFAAGSNSTMFKFFIGGKTLVPVTDSQSAETIAGGTIQKLSEASYRLTAVPRKSGRTFSIDVDSQGNILSLWEETDPYIFKPDSATIRTTGKILACVREGVQRRKLDQESMNTLYSYLNQVRALIAQGKEEDLEGLAPQCTQFLSQLPKRRKSDFYKPTYEHYVLNLGVRSATRSVSQVTGIMDAFYDSSIEECKSSGLMVRAAAIVGAKVGMHYSRCWTNDGRIYHYVGPALGFIVGLGGGVSLSKEVIYPKSVGNPDVPTRSKRKRISVLFDANHNIELAALNHRSWAYQDYEPGLSRPSANEIEGSSADFGTLIGAEARIIAAHARGLIRIKTQDNIESLALGLLSEIRVERSK